MSERDRRPVYKENTNTIMNLLADFNNYSYTLDKIEGFTINLQENSYSISIPRNMYGSVSICHNPKERKGKL